MDEWFSHSGDLGDIIYACPAIRGKGGGRLYLFNKPHRTTHAMTPLRMQTLRPLLIAQPYIKAVGYWQEIEASDHALNGFRDHMSGRRTLADGHLSTMGLPFFERNRTWLDVDRPRTAAMVIFSRTNRYHNPQFPWKAVLAKYHARSAFIGLRSEYEEFCADVGEIPYVETADALEIARVIAGSRLFVGNQSLCLAIAHGLKATTLVEVCREMPNCCFPRINCVHGWDDTVELPEVW